MDKLMEKMRKSRRKLTPSDIFFRVFLWGYAVISLYPLIWMLLYSFKDNDEIFVSGATLDNIEIIDAVTAAKIKASGKVVSSTSSTGTGVTSNTTGTSTGSGY